MNFNMKAIKSSGLFGGVKKLLDTNAPTVATFGSVLSLGLTMFFMHKASKAAAKVSEKYDEQLAELEIYRVDEDEEKTVEDGAIDESEYKTEKARIKMNKALSLVWVYRYAIVSGVASGALAFLSNYLNGRTIATITGALALSHDKLKTYMEKGKELLGDEKFEQMRNEINSELLSDQMLRGDAKIEHCEVKSSSEEEPEEGCELFAIDDFGWIIETTKGQVLDAISEAERMEYLTMTDFRHMLGLHNPCKFADEYAWEASYVASGEPGKMVRTIAKDSSFKAHIGFNPNIGEYGMKTIVFDNYPGRNRFGR